MHFYVVEATCGEEAVKQFRIPPTNFILLDVIGPGVDGCSACGALGTLPGGSGGVKADRLRGRLLEEDQRRSCFRFISL